VDKWRTDVRGEDGIGGDTIGGGGITIPFHSGPPPPFVKGRTTRGVQNETLAADLGGKILIVQTYLLVKMTCQPLLKLWDKRVFQISVFAQGDASLRKIPWT
jgi:hypothetical protein